MVMLSNLRLTMNVAMARHTDIMVMVVVAVVKKRKIGEGQFFFTHLYMKSSVAFLQL
jgi:type 1 glutamine amidotransferase